MGKHWVREFRYHYCFFSWTASCDMVACLLVVPSMNGLFMLKHGSVREWYLGPDFGATAGRTRQNGLDLPGFAVRGWLFLGARD
jgi:hypothetical protein